MVFFKVLGLSFGCKTQKEQIGFSGNTNREKRDDSRQNRQLWFNTQQHKCMWCFLAHQTNSLLYFVLFFSFSPLLFSPPPSSLFSWYTSLTAFHPLSPYPCSFSATHSFFLSTTLLCFPYSFEMQLLFLWRSVPLNKIHFDSHNIPTAPTVSVCSSRQGFCYGESPKRYHILTLKFFFSECKVWPRPQGTN